MSKSRKNNSRRAKRAATPFASKRSSGVNADVGNYFALSVDKQNIIGVKGGVINPIIRNTEFIVKVQNLPSYKKVESTISSKENLPKIHFSRETYRKIWTSVVNEYNNLENQSK
jgi:hypothetical protein